MIKGLLGKKLGMTQIFDDEKGAVVPVTVIQAGPCQVLQVKTRDGKDRYDAVQLGFDDRLSKEAFERICAWWDNRKARRKEGQDRRHWKGVKGAEIGHVKAAGTTPKHFVKEVPFADDAPKTGDTVTVAVFEGSRLVDVVGISKGRGFTGNIKRHNFNRGPRSHGSKNYREPGSIGCSAYPSRVYKGKRMAGQHGAKQRTSRNLEVVKVDAERSLLLVRGAVPGPNGGYLVIKPSLKG